MIYHINADDNCPGTIGQRIRAERINKGYSIQEFAKKLKRDYSFVVKYEYDERIPKDALLDKIASTLNVSPLYLKYGNCFYEEDDNGGLVLHIGKENNNRKDIENIKKEIAKNVEYLYLKKDLKSLNMIRIASNTLINRKNKKR